MRKMDKIVIHCSATPPDLNIGANTIKKWHIERGFETIGYHYVICRDGGLDNGRDEKQDGAHAVGHNKNSIGIALVGGVDKKNKPENNFTAFQWLTLESLINELLEKYPNAKIIGHNEVSNKACPSFDVQEWLKQSGIK